MSMIVSKDQLGREIRLKKHPERIISLVPSLSELLWEMNLKNELVGITKFCIHPNEMYGNTTRIGGTKNIQHDVIARLKPDLIIGNKEENTKEDIEILEKSFPVWMSDVNTLDEAISMIQELGSITHRTKEAEKIIGEIIGNKSTFQPSAKVIYLIWNDPCFAVGKETFIDDMISQAGFMNCVNEKRYPEITGETIQNLNPDFLFLSTEPFPFSENHFEFFEKFVPREKIKIVDGEMFSWYGSRLTRSFSYFQNLRRELNQR